MANREAPAGPLDGEAAAARADVALSRSCGRGEVGEIAKKGLSDAQRRTQGGSKQTLVLAQLLWCF